MIQKVFNVYFFLFIFVMINREFTPFGIDLRYFCFFIDVILLIYALVSKKKIKINSNVKKITLFYIIILISNIMWLFNSFSINESSFFVIFVSYVFNFMSYIVFVLYSDSVNIHIYKKSLLISLGVLILSMIYCIFFGDLSQTHLTTYAGRVSDISTNFFGGNYRISGFAQDPNYSSIFFMIGIITTVYFYKKEHKPYLLIYIIPLIVFYCFSASKTILVATIIAILYILLPKRIKKISNIILVLSVIVIPIIIVFFNIKIFENNISMSQRFVFWSFAKELFLKSPIIGSGLTAFRSYFLESAATSWYVQCHSTIFQILSENGLISLMIFANILYTNLKSDSKYISILTLIYTIFMVNTETLYHMYSIFIIGIVPIILESMKIVLVDGENKNKKKTGVIFLVNSLCNGGAERVVVNMANEYSKNNVVYIMTLYDEKTYKINESINIISLYNKKLSKLEKIYKMPMIINKVNKTINEIEEKCDIKLITSHLIYSNLISKLSRYREKIINVIHVSYKVYDTRFHYIFKKSLQLLYNHTPIVTVSKGCEDELINVYKVKPLYIETIYNPINFAEIQKLSQESWEEKEPFILFTGRLDKPKRPEVLLEAFYQGKFYQNYQLYIIGVGPYEQMLKNKINQYNLEDKVVLAGWQNNVFKFMKNAKLFVNCSRNEAFPMTIIEALSCDCPVVSFDIDYGPNEILINDLSGYLAENNNIDSMIKVMKLALVEYPKNLQKYVEQFDVKVVNDKYIKIYNKIRRISKNEII